MPVYALDACFGLMSNKYAWFWGSARDMYEVRLSQSKMLVNMAFFSKLIPFRSGIYNLFLPSSSLCYVGWRGRMKSPDQTGALTLTYTPQKNTIKILSQKQPSDPLFPFSFMGKMQMGEVFFYRCKFGVLQYVLVKPICCLVEVLTHAFGVYGGVGVIKWNEAYIYIALLTNTSQMVALFALVNFYIFMHEELRKWNPLPKFACIKMVVFFTYWQGFVLTTLQEYKYIRGTKIFSSGDVNHGLECLCLSIEMVVFAFCHHIVFEVKQFHDTDEPEPTPFLPSLYQAFYVEKLKFDIQTMSTEYHKLDMLGACGARPGYSPSLLARSYDSYGTAEDLQVLMEKEDREAKDGGKLPKAMVDDWTRSPGRLIEVMEDDGGEVRRTWGGWKSGWKSGASVNPVPSDNNDSDRLLLNSSLRLEPERENLFAEEASRGDAHLASLVEEEEDLHRQSSRLGDDDSDNGYIDQALDPIDSRFEAYYQTQIRKESASGNG